MGKPTTTTDKNYKYPYKSYFGSHKEMINAEETAKLNDPLQAVLEDENGLYTTLVERIDSGLADPNRSRTSRLKNLF